MKMVIEMKVVEAESSEVVKVNGGNRKDTGRMWEGAGRGKSLLPKVTDAVTVPHQWKGSVASYTGIWQRTREVSEKGATC